MLTHSLAIKVYMGTYSGNPVAIKDFQSRSAGNTVFAMIFYPVTF